MKPSRRKRIFLIYGLAFIIRLAFAVPFIHDWDGFVFSESAKNLLNGETPYQTVVKNDPSIYPDSDKPMIQQWYAYPPLPLLMFTAPLWLARTLNFPLTELTETLLLKSPFIIGDLVAAWLVWKLLMNRSRKLAERAELLILFNPLLIWVSGAWGMFDIWMANFLFMFILATRQRQVVRAGIYLALASTTKLFPVFFLPVIVIYTLGVITDAGRRWRLATAFGITLALIVTPFFLSSPRGFLNQNLLMHLQRPTQGLSLPAMYDHFADIYRWPELGLSGISSAVMYLTMTIVILRTVAAKIYSEEQLWLAIVIIYTSMLLFNKVSNEQYFVLLVALLTALLHYPWSLADGLPRRLLKALKLTATYGVLVAAALLGFHFLGFLLPGLTQEQFKSSTNHLVFYLSRHFKLPLYTYPDSALTYYNLPMTIASAAMIPFVVAGLLLVWSEWYQAWMDRRRIGRRVILLGKITLKRLIDTHARVKIAGAGLIVAGYLLVPSVKAYVSQQRLLEPVELIEEKDYQSLPADSKVGTFYNVWWNNFSHYKDFPYGDWSKTTLTPETGYYTSKNSYMVQHIKQMKQAGIDFALVPYHLYDRRRYLMFGDYAERLGLKYAPMIEIYDVLAYDKFRPVGPDGNRLLGFSTSNESKKALQNVIISSIIDNINSPAILRVQERPAIFLFYGHWFLPGWDERSKRQLAQRLVDAFRDEGDPFSTLSKSWSINVESIDDVISQYPSSIQGFNQNNKVAKDYKAAFIEEYKAYWGEIMEELTGRFGPLFFLTTYPPLDPSSELDPTSQKETVIQFNDFSNIKAFDGEFFYGVSSLWYSWRNKTDDLVEIKSRWEKQIEAQATRNRDNSRPLLLTVTPSYDERFVRPYNPFEPIPPIIDDQNTYDWGWETALRHNPDYILITSWNEFFEGTAIEPSKEYGDYYIGKTAEWVRKMRED